MFGHTAVANIWSSIRTDITTSYMYEHDQRAPRHGSTGLVASIFQHYDSCPVSDNISQPCLSCMLSRSSVFETANTMQRCMHARELIWVWTGIISC